MRKNSIEFFHIPFFPIPRYVPSLRPVNSASSFMAHMNRMARCMLWHIKYIMVFVSGQKLSILLYPQCNIIDVSTVNRSVKIPELCERILCYDNAFHILSYYFACFVSNAVAYLLSCSVTFSIIKPLSERNLYYRTITSYFKGYKICGYRRTGLHAGI